MRIERCKQLACEPNVVGEHDDLMDCAEFVDPLGNLPDPAMGEAIHGVIEDDRGRPCSERRLREEIGDRDDLLLALGKDVRPGVIPRD